MTCLDDRYIIGNIHLGRPLRFAEILTIADKLKSLGANIRWRVFSDTGGILEIFLRPDGVTEIGLGLDSVFGTRAARKGD